MENDVQKIKDELESIVPSSIVDAAKTVGEHLLSSVENHKRSLITISAIADKVSQIKKNLLDDIQNLASQKSEMVKDISAYSDDKQAKLREIENLINTKSSSIANLQANVEEASKKVNEINANIVGLLYEKGQLTLEISNLTSAMGSLRTNLIEIQNDVNMAKNKKEIALTELSDILKQVEDAQLKLKAVNNQITSK